MKSFKKIAASIAALATAATLSVGTLAVSANEVKKAIDSQRVYTEAEEQFIGSFDNDIYTKAAKYLIDNDVALSDAANIMKQYVAAKNNKAMKSARSQTRSDTSFYNESNLSTNQHYGVVISKFNRINDPNMNFGFSYYGDDMGFYIPLDLHSYDYDNEDESEFTYSFVATSSPYEPNYLDICGDVFRTSDQNIPNSTPRAIFDFPFGVNNNNTNEASLHSMMEFEAKKFKTPVTFRYRYETYVRGDVNHDGIVDNLDLAWLLEYNLSGGNHQLENDYADVEPNIASLVNFLGADAERDEVLDLADLTWVSSHIESSNNQNQ